MVRPRSAYRKISKRAFLEKTKRRSNQKKELEKNGTKWEKSILKQQNTVKRVEANILA